MVNEIIACDSCLTPLAEKGGVAHMLDNGILCCESCYDDKLKRALAKSQALFTQLEMANHAIAELIGKITRLEMERESILKDVARLRENVEV